MAVKASRRNVPDASASLDSSFPARGRAIVNVRQEVAAGPIGFSSAELLLIAVGNCSLGTLLNHPLLAAESVRSVNATLTADFAADPPRAVAIRSVIEVEVECASPTLADHVAELQVVAGTSPSCNSLNAPVSVELRIVNSPG